MYVGPCKPEMANRKAYGLIRIHLFTFCLWFLVSGCNPLAEITIQVMEPGSVTIPPHINKVSFINRSTQPYLSDLDSVPWTREELYILDTIINYRIFKGIKDALNQSPMFDLGTIYVLQVRRSDTNQSLEPLNSIQLDQVSRHNDPDALISLEYYKVYGNREFAYTDVDITAILEISSETYWRIYDMVLDTILDEHILKDTIIWQEYGVTPEIAYNKLPLVTDALREAGHHSGYAYGTRISPKWVDEYRYYYIGTGKEMREAAVLASTKGLSWASGIWRRLAYGENKRLAAKASFNMALVCEMEDLIDPALEWAAKSYMIKSHSFTHEYIRLLEKRKAEQERLSIQLPVMED